MIKGFPDAVVGVGYGEATFFKKDTWNLACKNARAEVARSYSGEIMSVIFHQENTGGVRQQYLAEQKTNVVLRNSRIIDVWIDTEGSTDRAKGAYALCVVPTRISSFICDLGEKTESLVEQGVPEWLVNPVVEKSVIRSIGLSQKSYFQEDQHSNAARNAAEEMQKIIGVKISEVVVIYEDLNESWVRSAALEESTDRLIDMIMASASERDYWVDDAGILGCEGCSYFLMELTPQADLLSGNAFENAINLREKDKVSFKKVFDSIFSGETL